MSDALLLRRSPSPGTLLFLLTRPLDAVILAAIRWRILEASLHVARQDDIEWR